MEKQPERLTKVARTPFLVLVFMMCLRFAPGLAGADDVPSAISSHRPVYFLAGDRESQVKMQVSFKINILNLYSFRNFGLFLGYNQTMFWRLYEFSSPFTTTEFNPEIFWRLSSKNNIFGDTDYGFLDYIQFGFYEHKSNGRDGPDSRGYDSSYLEIFLATGGFINVGLTTKYVFIWPWRVNDNTDIVNYIGSFQAKISVKITDTNNHNIEWGRIYYSVAWGGGYNAFDWMRTRQEGGLIFPSIGNIVRPYAQVFYGYNESILTYNKLMPNPAMRIGVIFE
jgi:outer membrane phospholipase A